jgi:hypothetical protein
MKLLGEDDNRMGMAAVTRPLLLVVLFISDSKLIFCARLRFSLEAELT